ncbi:MAG: DeoR/GlpR family DNA-binding transcription regulator [Bacilli bacterium]|nr:DeoR/GlpR family DNA-binding transcription regulator [Bacilli bacterium]
MIDISRRQQLIAFMKEKRKATVQEIAQHLYISEATVRRDLNELETVKIVRRIHGAAVYIDEGEEVSTDVRETRNKKEKELISRYAVRYIPAFQTLFLDNSTTALYVAKAMELSEKNVFTNGIRILNEIGKNSPKASLYLIGGKVDYSIQATVGTTTIDAIYRHRFDVCVMSCAAITPEGTYEYSDTSAMLKKAALSKSACNILVVDSSKFGKPATFQSAALQEYDLIVTDASDDMLAPYRAIGLNIINKK